MSAKRENFVPDTVYARIMDGKAMFPTAVSVEGQRMVFTSGQLAWDKDVTRSVRAICAPSSSRSDRT